ncbi:hypothetical protein HMPREF0591_3013 [Mycobacterium parascrofulaceum ATCC BAA-614]|uniref:Uncharacterized protein n=1 Tax=Mycobacterium parascrofulaceum ATCC BAA-614 TaxID=525368 RepID=D5PA19_9MYCO|nr:hypothetical protein HMPREF0591_3013 [Mycobacterium parascrofulaceum ATCC BAA-614]
MGDLRPSLGGEPPVGPPSGQWQPTYPPQLLGRPLVGRPRTWPAIALSAIAALLAVGAMVIAMTRPTSGPSGSSGALPATTTTVAYTAEQTAAAHQKLCDAYKLAGRAVQIETNGKNSERAGIATVNGAVMLEEAVNANPAMGAGDRAAALALAESYSNVAVVSSLATGSDDPTWQAALSDANAKDAAMQKVCGGA